ncbi:glycine zipper family protein [Marinospirillum perlucidum]|uniref:glycine zipper family protein n=1 Tax=Marinospirillum perlucidum TaxID=1982602 RepID=UPI00138FEC5A|nr:glycine zipper family protein [Marinospirillum perlucidum]
MFGIDFFKKGISILFVGILLTGCASKEIVITENSSDELRLLKEQGFYMARDLTRDEFEDYAEDREAMEQGLTREMQTASRGAGAVTGAIVGAVTGMGIGQFALFGAAGADGENEYSFDDDYGFGHWLFNRSGEVDINEVNYALQQSITPLIEPLVESHNYSVSNLEEDSIDGDGYLSLRFLQQWSSEGNKKINYYFYLKKVFDQESRSQAHDNDAFYLDNNILISVDLSLGEWMSSRSITLNNIDVFKELMKNLDEDYFLYLSPAYSKFILPMIIYGGDGHHEYLVETE